MNFVVGKILKVLESCNNEMMKVDQLSNKDKMKNIDTSFMYLGAEE